MAQRRRLLHEDHSPRIHADDVDDWAAAKKSAPPVFDTREGGPTSAASHSSRADESGTCFSKNTFLPSSDPRRMGNAAALDREMSNGGPADSAPTWAKKRGQQGTENGRPRLVLQPRTLPVSDGEHTHTHTQTGSASTSTKTNPFGDARPREQVLADKGQKIDQQLDSIASDFGKKVFRNGNGYRAHSPDGSWRKTDSIVDSTTPSEEKAEKDGDRVTAET